MGDGRCLRRPAQRKRGRLIRGSPKLEEVPNYAASARAPLNTAPSRISSLAPLVLRLAIGGLMAYHGFDKLRGGIDGVETMFTMMDVPAPALTATVVTALETIGGIALLVGIGTRLTAASLAVGTLRKRLTRRQPR